MQTDSLERQRAEDLIAIQHQMKSVLNENFKKNIVAFEKYKPEIACKFKNYQPKRAFDFFCTENGTPNLIYLDNNEFLYKTEDPRKFCEEQAIGIIRNFDFYKADFENQNDPYGQITFKYYNAAINYAKKQCIEANNLNLEDFASIPCCIMLGVGLGYQIAEVFKRIEIANFLLIEPDSDMFFASLFTFEWSDILDYFSSENVSLDILFDDKNTILVKLDEYKRKYVFSFATDYFPYVHYNNKKIDAIIDLINGKFDILATENGFFDDYLFGMSHACYSITHKKHFVLKTKLCSEYQNLPVFVIGSGPSLDNDLPFIRKNQDKAIIIACGTALDVLYHSGIKPDFYACTERIPEVSQGLSTISDKSFFDDIILLSGDVAHPKTTAYFKHTALFGKADEPLYTYLSKCLSQFKKIMYIQLMTPLVGNMGVTGAIYFGFKNLYLFGLDNGKKVDYDKIHSKYSTLYNERGANDTNGIYQTNEITEGNFGGLCKTGKYFRKSALNMGTIIALEEQNGRHINCTNCSDGIKIEYTIPKHSEELNEDFAKFPIIDKNKFFKYVTLEKTATIDISPNLLTTLFLKDDFDKVCMNIIKLIQTPFSSRIECVKNISKIAEYINMQNQYVDEFHKALISGSIKSIIAIIIKTLYSHPNENMVLNTAKELLEIAKEFLEEAMDLYGLLPNYILEEHRKYYKNGKVGKDTSHCRAPVFPKKNNIIRNNYDDPIRIFKKLYK